jgi:CYTH domain-containing protein
MTSEDIEVTRTYKCHYGCTWYISFAGEKVDIVIAEVDLSTLTSDETLTPVLVITDTRALSNNYRYVPMPSDLLFTFET